MNWFDDAILLPVVQDSELRQLVGDIQKRWYAEWVKRKIEKIKRRIDSGEYDTDAVLDATTDAIMDDLRLKGGGA